jgi:hypothetical protein
MHMMNMLSLPLRKGQKWDHGPNTWVKPRSFLKRQWDAWIGWLSQASGSHVTGAWSRGIATTLADEVTFYWASDGCKDDECTGLAAVGGFEHGRYWYYELTKQQQRLWHITLIESLGPVGNTLNLGPNIPTGVKIGVETDASAAMNVNAGGKSKSMAISQLMQLYVKTTEYIRLSPYMITSHLPGEMNDLADSISRAKWIKFFRQCEQLGLKPKRVQNSKQFLDIISELEKLTLQQQREELDGVD